jgi:hypothetical protein
MRRLDWRLVRPPLEGSSDGRRLADVLERAFERALDEPAGGDSEALADLEVRYEEATLAPCEAVDAPRVQDDPDWESRVVDEFGEADLDMELEEYLELRRLEPDCDRCPYASPYSLFPMDPCEFSAGMLEDVLDAELADGADHAMGPPEMRAYADALAAALARGEIHESDVLDVRDYLGKAIHFLRFWADLGFSVTPIDLEEAAERQARAMESDADDAPPIH